MVYIQPAVRYNTLKYYVFLITVTDYGLLSHVICVCYQNMPQNLFASS